MGRAPVLLALAVGDGVEEVVPEAALSLLSIQHELQGLALVGPQLHSQALHIHHVSSTWHHAGQAYNQLAACFMSELAQRT